MGTTDAPANDDEVRLHLVHDALRRHWLSIVASTVLFAVVAIAYTQASPESYTSVTRVLVRPTPGNALSEDVTSSTGQVTVAMQTEASLVSSPRVTELASERLGDTVEAGSPAVTASVPENTEIVQIGFTAGSAEAAQDGAQALAEAFLDYRRELAESAIDYQTDSLEQQTRAAQEELKSAADAASSPQPPADAASQVQLYASRLAALQSSLGELQTLDVRPGSVVTPARLPQAPSGMNPLLLVLGAALVGAGAGVAFAIWRERRDDRLRSGTQAGIQGLPVLSRVPEAGTPQVVGRGAGADLHESYRQAAVGVLAAAARPAVLVVSAVDDGTRAGEVSAHLALALHRSGHQVVLVDADGATSTATAVLAVSPTPGLRDVLRGEVGADAAIHDAFGLRVLPSGAAQPDSDDLLPGVALAELLEKLRGESDFVVVSAPPATTSAGAALAVSGDRLVLVAGERRSTNQAIAEAVERCHHHGVDVLGLVVSIRRGVRGSTSDARLGARLAPDLVEQLRTLFPEPLRLSVPRRLARAHEDAVDYLLLPSARHPKLVVPARPRAAAVSAVRNYRPAASFRDRIRRGATAGLLRTGLASLVFGRVRVTSAEGLGDDSIATYLGEVLGSPVTVGMHIGPRRAVRKPVLQVLGVDGRTVAFAKVGTTSFTRALVRHEAESIRHVAGRLARVVVPSVLDHGRWHGHEVLTLAPMTGGGDLERAALGAAMDEVARCDGVTTATLAASTYWAGVRRRLGRLPDSPTHRRLAAGIESIGRAHGNLRIELGSWHGDWTPWNMTSDGEHALVWDWEKFERGVPVGLDAVHHAVQGAVVVTGLTPQAAFERTRAEAESLLEPLGVPAAAAQALVSLYAVEIALRYLHDGEDRAGSTPMTRVASWLPAALPARGA